jgi:prolycopene isomerase
MSVKWDVVIIGSGIGALTCGAFLAKAGMKVKVLEKHYRIGGYAHSFNRGGFRFESGVHSVPMGEGGYIQKLLKALDIENRMETISHDSMYSAGIDKERWVMPATLDGIKDSLCSSFPHERSNVLSLFSDMESLYRAIVGPLLNFETKGNETNPTALKKYQEHTYQSYIESYIKDYKLQQLLYSQWPFTGLTPECTSTTFFSLLYYVHAVEGSHYLKGGFETLADALGTVITEHGGEISTKSTVTKLHCENGHVKHALLDSGETVTGDHFISNASPHHLLETLLEGPSINKLWLRRVKQLPLAASSVAVYLGLDCDISSLLPQNMLFWYKHSDFKRIQERIRSASSDEIDHLVLLRTPGASEKQTLFLMTYFNHDYTNNWQGVKDQIAKKMVDASEQIIPGLSKHIQCQVTASPSTFERYSGNTGGSLYGFANTSDRYSEAKIPMQTFIPNLYQTGHWCRGGGIWNVMESGFTVSKMLLKKTV